MFVDPMRNWCLTKSPDLKRVSTKPDETVEAVRGVGPTAVRRRELGNALMGVLDDPVFRDKDVIYFGEAIQDGLLTRLTTGS
jgi:hypothetical protein